MIRKIGILGAGAWGTALAMSLSRQKKEISLQAREAQVVETINNNHENTMFLSGHKLDPLIKATTSPKEACNNVDIIMLVVPAQYIRKMADSLSTFLKPAIPIVCCAKGIERNTGLLMSEIILEALPNNPLAILSGPTFAEDVALNLPTAVTLACKNKILCKKIAGALASPHFRVYRSNDLVGVQIGGAVKNVLAISCGILKGRRMGDNARAALITRGLAEISRLAIAKGAQSKTLMGLSGLGDLTLTCSTLQSRNFSLGMALAQGQQLKKIISKTNTVAEGVYTANSISKLSKKLKIDMPICNAIDSILNAGHNIDEKIDELLGRPLISEF